MDIKKLIILPVAHLKGIVELPGDKSISHRAVILGALSHGVTKIKNFLMAEDTLKTIDCFQKLGVKIKIDRKNKTVEIIGNGPEGLKKPQAVLDVGNSGTTMRILTGILAGLPFTSKITGDAAVQKRPMFRVIKPLRLMGAEISGTERNEDIYPPLTISGKILSGIKYQLPLASAQLKSALLLAGFLATGETEIKEPEISRDHTELMLKFFGAKLTSKNGYTIIGSGQKLSGRNLEIPGDISSAAFFIVAALILPGSKITLKKVGLNPGRVGLLEVLKKMGGSIKIINKRFFGDEPVGDLKVTSSELHGLTIEGALIPKLIDEIPILAVAGIFAKGKMVIKDARELRVKESDRINAVVNELRKMGVLIWERPDGFTIEGSGSLKGARVYSHGDHRIAMSLAIAGLAAKGKTMIDDTGCIDTSFPEFYQLLKQLR